MTNTNEIAVARIDEKREILGRDTVVRGLTPAEQRIAKLSVGRTIGDLKDKDVRVLENGTEKDFGAIAQVKFLAAGICRDYSIKGVEKTEVVRFYDILRRYYSALTIAEVRTAFEMAIVGELDEYLPKDRAGHADKSAYQKFSIEFVAKILGAYKRSKEKVWTKVFRLAEKHETEPTEAEKIQAKIDFRKAVGNYYVEYVEAGIVDIMFPFYVADYLVENGLAEQKPLEQRHFDTAKIILRDRSAEEKRVLFEGFETGNFSERLQSEALRLLALEIIRESFEKLKNEGIQDDYWN
jgi:hypothetical protein